MKSAWSQDGRNWMELDDTFFWGSESWSFWRRLGNEIAELAKWICPIFWTVENKDVERWRLLFLLTDYARPSCSVVNPITSLFAFSFLTFATECFFEVANKWPSWWRVMKSSFSLILFNLCERISSWLFLRRSVTAKIGRYLHCLAVGIAFSLASRSVPRKQDTSHSCQMNFASPCEMKVAQCSKADMGCSLDQLAVDAVLQGRHALFASRITRRHVVQYVANHFRQAARTLNSQNKQLPGRSI